MALLEKLPSSPLGLKGIRPATFDVNPATALHNVYSIDGVPKVRWISSNGNAGIIPKPSRMDELDPQAPNLKPVGVVSQIYKSRQGRRYEDLGPVEGRY
jgi:hypothetical protein